MWFLQELPPRALLLVMGIPPTTDETICVEWEVSTSAGPVYHVSEYRPSVNGVGPYNCVCQSNLDSLPQKNATFRSH